MSGLFKSVGHPVTVSDYLKLAEGLKLPQILTIVLIIVMAYQLADLTWRLVPGVSGPADVTSSQPPVPEQTTPAPTAQRNFAQVANYHLFGKLAVVAKPGARVVPKQAPVTKLNLVLYGVFAETDPRQGSAIIGKARADQRFYRVGESLGAGTTLAEVYEDHVLLDRNGNFEALYFPEGAKKLSTTSGNRTTSNKVSTAGAGLSQYRDILKNTPQKIIEYLQFVPVKIGGKLEGFRVLPKQDRTLFNRLGVTQSDIITAVNGIPVAGDTPEIPRLMQELSQADQLVLTAKRHGREQTITVNLN